MTNTTTKGLDAGRYEITDANGRRFEVCSAMEDSQWQIIRGNGLGPVTVATLHEAERTIEWWEGRVARNAKLQRNRQIEAAIPSDFAIPVPPEGFDNEVTR